MACVAIVSHTLSSAPRRFVHVAHVVVDIHSLALVSTNLLGLLVGIVAQLVLEPLNQLDVLLLGSLLCLSGGDGVVIAVELLEVLGPGFFLVLALFIVATK